MRGPKPPQIELSEQEREEVLAFIDYYSRTMAKPFQWTYKGKALAV